jgi:putative ABC transport system permease protein
MFRYLSLAFKNTLRNRRRSILTISSIAVSLCLLGVLMAMYHALFYKDQTPGQAMRLVTRHRVSLAQAIPVAYEAKIRNIPGVKEVSVWNWFGGTYKDARDSKNFFARLGVEPKNFLTIRTQMDMPEAQRQAFITDKTGCVISADLAETLKLKLGDRITLVGDIYPVNLELKVVGIFTDPDTTDSLFFNWEYLRDALPVARRSLISTVAILADSAAAVPGVAKAVDALFDNATPPTKTESEAQFALSERIKEVGVLKTLGFNNDAILGMLIGEAITISLIGGAIGLLIASVLTVGVGKAAATMLPQLHGLSVTPITAILAMGIAALIGFISSFIPAWNAARTSILDSLRYNG